MNTLAAAFNVADRLAQIGFPNPTWQWHNLSRAPDAGLLRSYEYQKLKRGEDPIQRALEQHSLTKDGLAYNND